MTTNKDAGAHVVRNADSPWSSQSFSSEEEKTTEISLVRCYRSMGKNKKIRKDSTECISIAGKSYGGQS